MKKIITKEQWATFVSNNSDITYSLVVCLCILSIWEASCKTEEEASAELHKLQLGLSGFQAESAISFALAHELPDWLDKAMVEISTPEPSL